MFGKGRPVKSELDDPLRPAQILQRIEMVRTRQRQVVELGAHREPYRQGDRKDSDGLEPGQDHHCAKKRARELLPGPWTYDATVTSGR